MRLVVGVVGCFVDMRDFVIVSIDDGPANRRGDFSQRRGMTPYRM
jgi:hypothetical protein